MFHSDHSEKQISPDDDLSAPKKHLCSKCFLFRFYIYAIDRYYHIGLVAE